MTRIPPDSYRAFCRRQIARLGKLISDSNETENQWNELIPEEIKGATGTIRIAPLKTTLHAKGMGGNTWIDQFILGIPIVGPLGQDGVYESSKKAIQPPIEPPQLFSDAEARFRERPSSSGKTNALELWGEASAQVARGWLNRPILLNAAGRFDAAPLSAINPAFRFGAEQLDKLRACGDLKRARTNAACSILTPNSLPTWDHIALLAAKAHVLCTSWPFFKTDHESAYIWIPIRPDRAKFAVVALRNPHGGMWYGFSPKSLMFGSTASVLHYTCLIRIIASLANRLLGLPMVGYIDDFGPICPSKIIKEALFVFTHLWPDRSSAQIS